MQEEENAGVDVIEVCSKGVLPHTVTIYKKMVPDNSIDFCIVELLRFFFNKYYEIREAQ